MEVKRVATGQRDQRVEIVEYTTVKNAINEDVKTEVSIGFFRAAMKDVSGKEDEEGKVIYLIDRTYTIPYQSDIKTRGEQMVLKHEGKEWQIYHVVELGRRDQLLLQCTVTKRE